MSRRRRPYQPRRRSGALYLVLVLAVLVGAGVWALASGFVRVEIGGGTSPPPQPAETSPDDPAPEVVGAPAPLPVPDEPTPPAQTDADEPSEPAKKVPTLEEIRDKRPVLEALLMDVSAVWGKATSDGGGERGRKAERAMEQAGQALGGLQQCEDALRGGNESRAAYFWKAIAEREKAARSYLKEVE